MNQKIFGIAEKNKSYHFIEIFGYDTRGIPGIEIIGLGRKSRQLKEKIIFLGRRWGFKVPLKRYVICLEHADQWEKDQGLDLNDLEIPIFILYLSLIGKVNISRLDNCFCGGRISINGHITPICFPSHFLHLVNERAKRKDKRIIALGDHSEFKGSHLNIIPLKEIFDRPLIY